MKIKSMAGICVQKPMKKTFPAVNKEKERADQDMLLCMASSAPDVYLSLFWCHNTVQMEVINGNSP